MSGRRARAIRQAIEAHARSVRWPGDPQANPAAIRSITRRARREYTRRGAR